MIISVCRRRRRRYRLPVGLALRFPALRVAAGWAGPSAGGGLLRTIAVLVLLSGMGQPVLAQPGDSTVEGLSDYVTLKQDNGSRIRVRCNIVDYTGNALRYRTRVNGPVNTAPVDRVTGITTARVPAHRQALEHLQRHEYAQTRQQLEQALQDEPREWVRREILALSVQAALASDDFALAGSRFLLLYESDPQTPHADLFPLPWSLEKPADALVEEALRWQTRNTAAAKLMSAAVLLMSPPHQQAAAADLRALSVNADRRVQRLAQTQLWRWDLLENRASDAAVSNWEFSLDLLPEDLRGGPHFVVAMAHRNKLRYAAAAEHYLWTGLVHNANASLAARSLVAAAKCLHETGRSDGADTLLREVRVQYPATAAVGEATELLQNGTSRD